MKIKILIFVLSIFLIGSMSWAEEANKTLVVYYSRTGNTAKVADQLAEKFNADKLRIRDKKNRMGVFGFSSAGKDGLAQNLTEIEPYNVNLEKYTTVLLGTPSWFSNITPAIRTFISENDLTGMVVGIFATTNKTGAEKALAQMSELVSGKKENTIVQLPLRTKDLKDKDVLSGKIESFFSQIKQEESHQ